MPLKTHSDEPPSLNLTAMLNVMFLLIIFFMLGTRLSTRSGKSPCAVPEVANRSALPPAAERKMVNVYRDGSITIDQQPVTLSELTAKLAALRSRRQDLGVLVRGDAQGNFKAWPPS